MIKYKVEGCGDSFLWGGILAITDEILAVWESHRLFDLQEENYCIIFIFLETLNIK